MVKGDRAPRHHGVATSQGSNVRRLDQRLACRSGKNLSTTAKILTASNGGVIPCSQLIYYLLALTHQHSLYYPKPHARLGTDWFGQDAATPTGRSVPVQLHAHAFMPPWTIFTGLDFAGIAPFVDAISPKLYTMHWAQMIVRMLSIARW